MEYLFPLFVELVWMNMLEIDCHRSAKWDMSKRQGLSLLKAPQLSHHRLQSLSHFSAFLDHRCLSINDRRSMGVHMQKKAGAFRNLEA